jgi:hypothetical protein
VQQIQRPQVKQVASQEVQLLQVQYVACSDFTDEDLREPGIIGVPDFDEDEVQEDFFGEPVVGLLIPASKVAVKSEDVVKRVPPVSERRLDWCRTGDVGENVNCEEVSWSSKVIRMSQEPSPPMLVSVMKCEDKQTEQLSDKVQQSVSEETDCQGMDQQVQYVRPAKSEMFHISVRTEETGISPRQGHQVTSATTETGQGSAFTEPSSPGEKRSPTTASSRGEPPYQERLETVNHSRQQLAP